MPRLCRRIEFVGLMLLGLLPTHAITTNTVLSLDPAAVLRSSALAFSPSNIPSLVSLRGAAGHSLCQRRAKAKCSLGRLNGLANLRAAINGHTVSGGEHAKHHTIADAAHVLQPRSKVLVTGGAGYIGSHICADLLQSNYDVVVLDNFVNSSPKALERAMELGGRELTVYEGDTRDLAALRHVFESELTISSVIHLAGLKAVGESVAKPTMYYDFKYVGLLPTLLLHTFSPCLRVSLHTFTSACFVFSL